MLTLSTSGLIAVGAAVALIGTGPGHSTGMQTDLIRLLAGSAIAVGAVLGAARDRRPSWSRHLDVLLYTAAITVATSVSGETSAALYASLYLLVVLHSCLRFRGPAALVHCGAALTGSQLAFAVVGVPVVDRIAPVVLVAAVAGAVGRRARWVEDLGGRVVVERSPLVLQTLRALREASVRVTADDVGTGDADLDRPERIPAEILPTTDHSPAVGLIDPVGADLHPHAVDPGAQVAAVEAALADLECSRYSGSTGIEEGAYLILATSPGPHLSTQRTRAQLILTDQASRTDVSDAVTTAQAILLRARARGEFTVAARSEAIIASCLERLGARGDAVAHAVEAVRLLPADAPPHLVVDHRMILALFNAMQTSDESYRAVFDAVLVDATMLGNPHLLVAVLNNYAWVLWSHAHAAEALPLVDRMETLAGEAGIGLSTTSLDTIASVLLDAGDPVRAETVGRLMVDPRSPEAEARAAPEALLTLARIRHRRGDAAEALSLVLRAERIAADRSLPELTAMATMDKSQLLAEAGDVAGAYAALKVSHDTWIRVRDRDADARASSLQALFETEQARERSAIFEDLADRDALTGLWNRRHLDRVLPDLLTEHQMTGIPLGIAILDLDHFKRINDDRDHATGDTVLTRIGELLQDLLPEPGFTARLGGEEFLLVRPGADPTAMHLLCERTRRLIEREQWGPVTGGLTVTASIGHTGATPTSTTASLLGAADTALYEAKNAGRNQVRPVPAPDRPPTQHGLAGSRVSGTLDLAP